MLYSVILLCASLILYNTPSVSGKPLFLTPYIQKGKSATARKLSLVNDKEGIIPISHAGFVTVDQNVGNHLFFWFFPTLNSNSSAPLLVWLNGGPGESSMIGLIHENGPIQLGKSSGGETIYIRRNNSWVDKFSMLYIDNPVGAGYSFSDNMAKGKRSTQDNCAEDLFRFIHQFYQMFPEFLQRDLYIGGESYAGKYVPAFARKIHQEMLKTSRKFKIPLKGIYLGGPIFDARVQLLQLFDLYYTLGYISNTELFEYKQNFTSVYPPFIFQKDEDLIYLFHWNSQDNVCTYKWSPSDDISAVMTSGKLRSLLHVDNSTFTVFNGAVYLSVFSDDLFVSSASKLNNLMDKYKVLIYTGDLDGIVTASGLESVFSSLMGSLSLSAYKDSRRMAWRGENDTLKGFYTQASTFCRVVIRGAGHRSGFDQPHTTLEMMDQFVTNGCLK